MVSLYKGFQPLITINSFLYIILQNSNAYIKRHRHAAANIKTVYK